jgi:hypothetical protein
MFSMGHTKAHEQKSSNVPGTQHTHNTHTHTHTHYLIFEPSKIKIKQIYPTSPQVSRSLSHSSHTTRIQYHKEIKS